MCLSDDINLSRHERFALSANRAPLSAGEGGGGYNSKEGISPFPLKHCNRNKVPESVFDGSLNNPGEVFRRDNREDNV